MSFFSKATGPRTRGHLHFYSQPKTDGGFDYRSPVMHKADEEEEDKAARGCADEGDNVKQAGIASYIHTCEVIPSILQELW